MPDVAYQLLMLPPAALPLVALPTKLESISFQSIHNQQGDDLARQLIASSSETLRHVIVSDATIEPPEELGVMFQPIAVTLESLSYYLIQRTPHALVAGIHAIPTLKHLIMPVDILRTPVVLAALVAKAANPAHAELKCLTVGAEEYHRINSRAPKVMPARRLRLMELARVVKVGKVRIGRAMAEATEGFAEELERRGVALELVEEEEHVKGEQRSKRWVWH